MKPDDARGDTSRDRYRERSVNAIPRWYNPWLHLGATTTIGIVTIVTALTQLHRVRAIELLVVPILLVVSNAAEWRIHRDLLHHRIRPLEILYDRHTPQHHRIYTFHDMAIRSTRELRLVLIPAFGIAGAVLLIAPFALGTGYLLGANVGWLVWMTSSFYVVAYEWSHLSYHLPEESVVGRMRVVRFLREHHRRHHDPRLMQRWNFNVTIPLWDIVRGTVAGPAQLESIAQPHDDGLFEARAQRSQSRG